MGRGNNAGRGNGRPRPITGPKFKGTTAEMQGHVFECFDEQRDRKQFTRTWEMVGEYVKKHLKYPEDLSPLFGDTIGTPTVPRPQPLAADADKIAGLIWNEEIKEHVKRSRELCATLLQSLP
jgi:hypothetical protein